MKNTISTSIGGIVFHVEEDAHQKLSSYLNAIGNSLKDSEGRDEIMKDIEGRIAEILQQKLSDYKQVIAITDIDEVINVMGQPEDYSTGQTNTGKKEQTWSAPGYGNTTRRRIYRDPDDKVIFGVCSGISHHFGFDPLWVRLGFGVAFFTAGFGIIPYLLLAAIIPKAKTAAEKLEMRGEPVDVNNLKKIFEEEMSHIHKKVRDLGNEIKDGGGKNRAKQFGNDLGDFFASVGNGAGRALGGIIKAVFAFIGFIFTFVGIILLIALIVSLFSGVNVIHLHTGEIDLGHHFINRFFDLLSITGSMRTILLMGIFLFIGIPLLSLVIRFSRAAMGIKQGLPLYNVLAGIAWSVGLIFIIIGVASISSDFSVTSHSRDDNKIQSTSKQMLYIAMTPLSEYNNVISLDSMNLYISDESIIQGNPSLCIEQSPDSSYHLITNRMARGRTANEALKNAGGIDYNFSNQDSALTLEPVFSLQEGTGWRKQKLGIILEVPLNKSISLPKGIDRVLCSALHHKGQRLGGSAWTMSATGLIPCK